MASPSPTSGRAADRPPPGRGRVAGAARDLVAGLLVGALVALVTVSLASLLVGGALAPYRADAITLFLIGTLVVGVVVAVRSSLPGAIGHAQDIPAAALASIGASLVASLPGHDAAFATLVALVTLTALATGAVFLTLGALRLGRLVRFVPYPVVGGFLAGTGWILLIGAIGVMSGVVPTLSAVGELVAEGRLLLWGPGLALAVATIVVGRVTRHALTFPVLIALAIVGFYALMALSGGSLETWREAGLLLGPFPEGAAFKPFAGVALADVDAAVLLRHLGGAGAVVLVSVLGLLFNATGLEVAADRPIDLDREMRTAGIANLLGGAAGGSIGYHGLGCSTLIRRTGNGGRTAAFVALAVVALTLVAGPALLELVPTFVVGGVLAYLGLLFLVDWVVAAATRLSRLEYGIVLAITVAIAALGFLYGVAIGLGLAIVLFIVTYSRVDAVRHAFTGAEATSRVVRSPAERRRLAERGGATLVLQLNGYLFFGSANGLSARIERHLAEGGALEHLVLDFRQVSGLDATAAAAFRSLITLSARHACSIVFSALPPEVEERLRRFGLLDAPQVSLHPSEDAALEWCEGRLLARPEGSDASATPSPWAGLGVDLAALLPYLERQDLPRGGVLVAQGDPADVLYLLESGRVSAVLGTDPRTQVRLETMEGGALVGEIGFYTGSPRGATVIADAPSVVYGLRRDRLEELARQDPALASAFHRFVALRLAERTTHLVGVVTALQR
jgi:sulfate permease, SulP family